MPLVPAFACRVLPLSMLPSGSVVWVWLRVAGVRGLDVVDGEGIRHSRGDPRIHRQLLGEATQTHRELIIAESRPCTLVCFFHFPFNTSALLFSLPPSRDSDSGTHSRLSSPLPSTVHAIIVRCIWCRLDRLSCDRPVPYHCCALCIYIYPNSTCSFIFCPSHIRDVYLA